MSSDEEGELQRMPQGEQEPLIRYGGINSSEYRKRRCGKCLPCCIVTSVIVFVVSILLAAALTALLSYNEIDAEFKHIVADVRIIIIYRGRWKWVWSNY